jgi:hypothetical protein
MTAILEHQFFLLFLDNMAAILERQLFPYCLKRAETQNTCHIV